MIVEFPNPDSLAECLIADELSRLRDEVKALRAERDALRVVQPSAFDPAEALRLADRCESLSQIADAYSAEAYEQAAAELRRQHAEIERLKAQRNALRGRMRTLRSRRWRDGKR